MDRFTDAKKFTAKRDGDLIAIERGEILVRESEDRIRVYREVADVKKDRDIDVEVER